MINIRVMPPLPGCESASDGLFHLPGSTNFMGLHEWYVRIAYSLEPGDDGQYPLDDILDRYFLAVDGVVGQPADDWHLPDSGEADIVLAGEPDDLRRCMSDIVGHRVSNKDSTSPDGTPSIALVISDEPDAA